MGIEIFLENGKYRVCDGYGAYFNKRYEVQESYVYYKNETKVNSWRTLYASKNLDDCKRYYHRILTEPRKNYKIDEVIF